MTQGLRQVYDERSKDLERYGTELQQLLSADLLKLNDLAKSLSVPNIIVPSTSEAAKKP